MPFEKPPSKRKETLAEFQVRLQAERPEDPAEVAIDPVANNKQGEEEAARRREIEVAEQRVLVALQAGDLKEAGAIVQQYKLPDRFIRTPEVQSSVREALIALPAEDIESWTAQVSFAVRDFEVSDSTLLFPEIQARAHKAFLRQLETGSFIPYVPHIFKLSEGILHAPDIQAAAKELIFQRVRREQSATGVATAFIGPDSIELAELCGIEDVLDSPEFISLVKEAKQRGARRYSDMLAGRARTRTRNNQDPHTRK